MRTVSLKKLISLMMLILVSGCSVQSSQLSSLVSLIKKPSLDLSENSWLVRYSGYESVVYAVSTNEGTLFSNKTGDKVLLEISKYDTSKGRITYRLKNKTSYHNSKKAAPFRGGGVGKKKK